MVEVIFEVISEAISSFTTNLLSAVNGITALFYVAPSGTETTGHMTFLGVLLLIAAGIGLVYWAFRTIRGLVARA